MSPFDLENIAHNRHPSVKEIVQFFNCSHLDGVAYDIALEFIQLVYDLLLNIECDSAELTAALRKLLEAKDCAIRHVIYYPNLDRSEGG